jgi:hypothetical protein
VIISVAGTTSVPTQPAFQEYSAAGTLVASIPASIPENFGFNTTTRQILSPQYSNGTSIDLISLNTLTWYTTASPPAGLSDPDHGAIDTGLNLGITANEFSSGTSELVFTIPLSGTTGLSASRSPQAAVKGPSPTVTSAYTPSSTILTSSVFNNCDTSADGIAVDSSAHLAFFASEYCGPGGAGIGVAQLPGLSTYIFAAMPSLPGSAGGFQSNHDPHALTVFNLPGSCQDCAVIANLQQTYLAVINLQSFLNVPAGNLIDSGHTVDTSGDANSYDLVANGVVRYIATGLSTASAARRTQSQQNRHI